MESESLILNCPAGEVDFKTLSSPEQQVLLLLASAAPDKEFVGIPLIQGKAFLDAYPAELTALVEKGLVCRGYISPNEIEGPQLIENDAGLLLWIPNAENREHLQQAVTQEP
ncbi:MAG: hypothetical protein PHS44_00950 [Candidatus Dojkabacteria bacterium]|jgi:hypothetical protein|nr:hypothetical protein [Candidatus Dojkabacteria bacterium]